MIRKVKCASYCWPDTLSTLGDERCGAVLMPLLYKAIAQRWRARGVGRDRVQAFQIVGREMHSHQESAAPGRSRATRTLGRNTPIGMAARSAAILCISQGCSSGL